MRFAAALLIFACLSACSMMAAQQDQPFISQDDAARQQQAVMDANAILQGMAQARQNAQELARSTR